MSTIEQELGVEIGEATAVAAKPKQKGKAKAKAPVDIIAEVSHEVENMTKEEALAAVKGFSDEADYSHFRLGGALSVIQANQWHTDLGYGSLRDLIEQEYGLNYRTGMYWIGIYNGLVESGVPWDKVKDLGWTKLRDLARYLTLDNVDEWVGKVKDMTVLQMRDYIKQKNQGALEGAGDAMPGTNDKVSHLHFKLHKDQKETVQEALSLAKHEAGTEYDNVALEALCMNYLANSVAPVKPVAPAGLKEAMGASTWQEVLEAFEELWPEVSLTVEMEG